MNLIPAMPSSAALQQQQPLPQQKPSSVTAPLSVAPAVAAPYTPPVVPVAPVALPPEHLRELSRLLAKNGSAAEAYLQTLDREEAALLLCEVVCRFGRRHRTVQIITALAVATVWVVLVRLNTRNPAGLASVGGMLINMVSLALFSAATMPSSRLVQAAEVLSREAQHSLTSARHAGPLMDAFQTLEAMRHKVVQASRARIATALARLLPRLSGPELSVALTPPRRAMLRRALRRAVGSRDAYPDDFTVAALLALGTAGDERAAPVARRYLYSPSERLQAAAEECLRSLGMLSA
jgi:hypothetical protein